MKGNLNSNNIEKDEFNVKTEDYNYLIVKLKEIKSTIALLEKTIFISSFIGWSLGISKNSCNPYFEQNIDQLN